VRRALVVAEVAFALVLLAGAGLLFRSLQELFAIAPGFDDRHVLALQVQVAGPPFSRPDVVNRYFASALDRVKAVPGVTHATLTSLLPLSGDADIYGLQFESADSGGATDGAAFRYAVTPGYLDTMGIALRRGRFIADQDRAGAPPAVVINETFAARRFPDSDPIGQRFHIGPTDRPWFTVVGVVGNVKQMSLEEESNSAVYVAPAQWHFADRSFWFVVRTAGDPAALTASIRDAIWSVDRDQPIVRVGTLASVVAATARERSFALLLFEVFGISALLLTAIGMYGVISSGVSDRRREIGIRTALGASRASILGDVLGEGARLAAIGVALGLVAAAASTRGLSSMLFGISPLDPWAYGTVIALLLGVAMLACWLPARRAVFIDPAQTLRAD
jgi:predicted permease